MAIKNKIVEYYKPNDERLEKYYLEYLELLGLDKQPFGLDENGTLRFETKEVDSRVWKRYKELGGSENEVGDLNVLWTEYHYGKFTLDEMLQLYRETGSSLCHMIDCFSEKFYEIKDKEVFQKSLNKLKESKDIENSKQEILDKIFLAHLDSVQDRLIFNYRKEAKKIINKNFGEDAWEAFIQSLKIRSNGG